MQNIALHVVARRNLQLKNAADTVLPLKASYLRLVILLSVVARCDQGITHKELLVDSKHSETALRYQITSLHREGWLRFDVDENDKRKKLIFPSDQLLRQMEILDEMGKKIFSGDQI